MSSLFSFEGALIGANQKPGPSMVVQVPNGASIVQTISCDYTYHLLGNPTNVRRYEEENVNDLAHAVVADSNFAVAVRGSSYPPTKPWIILISDLVTEGRLLSCPELSELAAEEDRKSRRWVSLQTLAAEIGATPQRVWATYWPFDVDVSTGVLQPVREHGPNGQMHAVSQEIMSAQWKVGLSYQDLWVHYDWAHMVYRLWQLGFGIDSKLPE